MIISVEIDDSILSSTAKVCLSEAFKGGTRYDTPGAGYLAVRDAVNRCAAKVDFDSLVESAVGPVIERVLEEVLKSEVEKRIKARVKELVKEGKIDLARLEGLGAGS